MEELIVSLIMTQFIGLCFLFQLCRDKTDTIKTHEQIVRDFNR